MKDFGKWEEVDIITFAENDRKRLSLALVTLNGEKKYVSIKKETRYNQGEDWRPRSSVTMNYDDFMLFKQKLENNSEKIINFLEK